jgi:hypothetical protein
MCDIHWLSTFSSSVNVPLRGFFFGYTMITPGRVKP